MGELLNPCRRRTTVNPSISYTHHANLSLSQVYHTPCHAHLCVLPPQCTPIIPQPEYQLCDPDYLRQLCLSFFYKFILSLQPSLPPRLASAAAYAILVACLRLQHAVPAQPPPPSTPPLCYCTFE
jgi:hypothetical protein